MVTCKITSKVPNTHGDKHGHEHGNKHGNKQRRQPGKKQGTCRISATSGPTKWMPSTLSVVASTTTLMKPLPSFPVNESLNALQTPDKQLDAMRPKSIVHHTVHQDTVLVSSMSTTIFVM